MYGSLPQIGGVTVGAGGVLVSTGLGPEVTVFACGVVAVIGTLLVIRERKLRGRQRVWPVAAVRTTAEGGKPGAPREP